MYGNNIILCLFCLVALTLMSAVKCLDYRRFLRGLTEIPHDIPAEAASVTISFNYIIMLRDNAFSNLSVCTNLYLSQNSISHAEAGAFNGLSKLKYLYLYNNKLTRLPASLFNGLSDLEKLHLHENRLTALPPVVFNGLGKLKDLWLNDNQLTNISASLFTGLSDLEKLELSSNQLTDLPPVVFNGLGKLTYLALGINKLTELPASLFNDLSNLERLFLYSNQLTDLSASLFDHLSNLKILKLHNNQLTELPALSFRNLSNLEDLSIGGNQLTDLSPSLFKSLTNLKTLLLPGNQLTELPASFTGLTSLSHLEIQNNKFATISSTAFSDLPRPLILITNIPGYSTNPPLRCDDALCWLKQEEQAGNITWYNNDPYAWKPECAGDVKWDTWNCSVPVACGVPTIEPHPRHLIAGGTATQPHLWPWMVSLRGIDFGGHICGGSLISNNLVITAAHCLPRNGTMMYLGAHDQDLCTAPACRTVNVTEVWRHPNYTRLGGRISNNDLAVVKFSPEVEFTDKISPVCIPDSSDELPVGTVCYVTGWGNLWRGSFAPQHLQELPVELWHQRNCSRKMWRNFRPESMICARNSRPYARGPCDGDSGGPLVCRMPGESRWKLFGIISWGFCGRPLPTAFVRVMSFLPWINDILS